MSEFLNPQEITALSRTMLRSRWDEAQGPEPIVKRVLPGDRGADSGQDLVRRTSRPVNPNLPQK